MSASLRNGMCGVFEGGYQWIDSYPAGSKPDEAERYLVESSSKGPSSKTDIYRTYNPLEVENLFLKFANLESDEQILGFADQYGLLGNGITESLAGKNKQAGQEGERLSAWANEAKKVANAIELRAAIIDNNKEWLESKIPRRKLGDTHSYMLHFKPLYSSLSFTSKQGKKPDYQLIANDSLDEIITKQLSVGLGAKIVSVGMGNRKIEPVPSSLLTALWVQFAIAQGQYRKCSECGIWFALPPGKGRRDGLYCSNACKVKAYRKRKEEAYQSAAKKMNISVEEFKKRGRVES